MEASAASGQAAAAPEDYRIAFDGVRLDFGNRSVFRGLSCDSPPRSESRVG